MPDGRLMPGCAYNMFFRHKDARYVGATGKADIWGGPRPGEAVPVALERKRV
jgi:hypothetical protein